MVLRRPRQRQEDFQAFLRELRRRYPGPTDLAVAGQGFLVSRRSAANNWRPSWTATLLWLPKQCPELNAEDHLWKELKRLIAANRQFRTIDNEATYAERWLLGLTAMEALRKAGVLSDDFWLSKTAGD